MAACEIYTQKSCGCYNALLHLSKRFLHEESKVQMRSQRHDCLAVQTLLK